MLDLHQLALGVTAEHPCSYLPQQSERLIFTLPDQLLSPDNYHQLMSANFRRTGEQLYRPYCQACQACQSVRIDVRTFHANRSQRKLQKQALARDWHWRVLPATAATDYFPLFAQYIRNKHAGSVMDPADPDSLAAMLHCQWLDVQVLEQYLADQLVAVLILDPLPDGLSAVYSFYQTDTGLALGKLAIIAAINWITQQQLRYLYLGFYIADCQKMAYKADFGPQQRLIGGYWQSFD